MYEYRLPINVQGIINNIDNFSAGFLGGVFVVFISFLYSTLRFFLLQRKMDH